MSHARSEFRWNPRWVSASLLLLWVATGAGSIAALQGIISVNIAIGILLITAVADIAADPGTRLLVGLLFAIALRLLFKFGRIIGNLRTKAGLKNG